MSYRSTHRAPVYVSEGSCGWDVITFGYSLCPTKYASYLALCRCLSFRCAKFWSGLELEIVSFLLFKYNSQTWGRVLFSSKSSACHCIFSWWIIEVYIMGKRPVQPYVELGIYFISSGNCTAYRPHGHKLWAESWRWQSAEPWTPLRTWEDAILYILQTHMTIMDGESRTWSLLLTEF